MKWQNRSSWIYSLHKKDLDSSSLPNSHAFWLLIKCLLLFNQSALYTWTWLSSPSQAPLPYMRHDVALMCQSELRTAGWEVGCTPGAHEARQDQAADRNETFLCIHEYHSSERERGRRTKETTEVNDFSVSSRVRRRSLRPLVVAMFKTRKSSSCGRNTREDGSYWQPVSLHFVSLLWCIKADIISVVILTTNRTITCIKASRSY